MRNLIALSALLILSFSTLTSYSQLSNFSISPYFLCSNGGVTTATAGIIAHVPSATTYSWVIAAPNSSCTTSFSTAASATGAPTNSVINMDLNGCGVYTIYCQGWNTSSSPSTLVVTMTQTANVLCAAGPTLSVSSSVNDATVCPGSSVTLSAASNATDYAWVSLSNSPSVVVSPSVNTCYNLIVSNSLGCQASTVICVNVQTGPSLSVTGTSSLCYGSSGTLVASGATSYTWSTGANTSSISVTPSVNTSYSIVASDGTCVNTTTVMNITVVPNPSITLTASKDTLCLGGTATLVASGANSYSWANGATSFSAIILPLTSTIFSISGISNNCSSTQTINITVVPFPTLSLTSSKNPICSKENIVLFVSGATTYTWMSGATSNSISVTPLVNTSYSVFGSVSGCISSQTINIMVLPLPILVTNSNTSICLGESVNLTVSGVGNYTWTNYPSILNPLVSPSITTVYTVTGTGPFGCTNTATTSVSVDACTGIDSNLEDHLYFSFYPNPASDKLTLMGSTAARVNYFIYDLIGNEILKGEFLHSKTIDLFDFAKGTYFVRFESAQWQMNKKLIIE